MAYSGTRHCASPFLKAKWRRKTYFSDSEREQGAGDGRWVTEQADPSSEKRVNSLLASEELLSFPPQEPWADGTVLKLPEGKSALPKKV